VDSFTLTQMLWQYSPPPVTESGFITVPYTRHQVITAVPNSRILCLSCDTGLIESCKRKWLERVSIMREIRRLGSYDLHRYRREAETDHLLVQLSDRTKIIILFEAVCLDLGLRCSSCIQRNTSSRKFVVFSLSDVGDMKGFLLCGAIG
jgi:hypothetical protein